jgi:hypothetical protein
VAEDHHTWVTLRRAARDSTREHGGVHLGYGAGKQFPKGVHGTSLLEPPVRGVASFGDLDADGLRIPVVAASAARAAGLPEVRPALGCTGDRCDTGCHGPRGPWTRNAPLSWL